jgi:hypothetical protein
MDVSINTVAAFQFFPTLSLFPHFFGDIPDGEKYANEERKAVITRTHLLGIFSA